MSGHISEDHYSERMRASVVGFCERANSPGLRILAYSTISLVDPPRRHSRTFTASGQEMHYVERTCES